MKIKSYLNLIFFSSSFLFCQVTFYGDSDFKGSSEEYSLGGYPKVGSQNDKFSSIEIPNDYQVVIYQHGDFKGRKTTLTKSIKNLNDIGFGDYISSLKVEKYKEGSNVVIVYEHGDYKGRYQNYGVGDHNRVWLNDKISSIKIADGYEVVIYQDGDFKGNEEILSFGEPNLKSIGFNDKISSIKIVGAEKKENQILSLGEGSTILFKGGNDGKPLLDMQISKFDVEKIGNRRINGMGTLTFSEELNMDQYEIAVLYIVERGGIQKPKSIQFPKIKKTTKDQKTVKEILWGKYPGIGIQYKRSIDGYISVIATTMGGPSEKAGIQSGDLIIGINGTHIKYYTHRTTYKKVLPEIFGAKKGTSVDLKIRRGITDPFDVTVITVDIPLGNENIQYYSQFNIGEYGDDFYVLISEKNQKNMVKVKEIVKKANKKMHKSFFEDSKVNPSSLCIDIAGTYEGEGDDVTFDKKTMKFVKTGGKTEEYLKINDDCSVYYRESTPSRGLVGEGEGTVNKTRDKLNIYLGDDLGYFTPSIIIENDSYGNKMIKSYNNHTNEINFILKCKSGCDRDRIIPSYKEFTANQNFTGFYSTIGEFLEFSAKEVNEIYNIDLNLLSPYKKYYYKKELRDAKLYSDFKVVITYQVKTDIPELELSGIDTFTWKFKDDILLVYDHSHKQSGTFNRNPYFNITIKTKGLDINKKFNCCSDEFLDWDFAEIIETLNQGIKSKEINSIYFTGNINSVNREISSKEDAGKFIGSLFTRRGNKDGEYFLIKKRPTLFSNPQYWNFNDELHLYSIFHIVDSDSLR